MRVVFNDRARIAIALVENFGADCDRAPTAAKKEKKK